jgi:hypothetical protein
LDQVIAEQRFSIRVVQASMMLERCMRQSHGKFAKDLMRVPPSKALPIINRRIEKAQDREDWRRTTFWSRVRSRYLRFNPLDPITAVTDF